MAESTNPTMPRPTWSFDSVPVRHEDTSEAASRKSPSPRVLQPQRSFDDLLTCQKSTSTESAPLTSSDNATAFDADTTEAAPNEAEHPQAEPSEAADAAPEQPDTRRYKPRTCRICFDEVTPTLEPVTSTTKFLRQTPRVVYISDDPDCGRLMRPCKCKGTQKYVHEGCLRAWRMAAGADRNLWKCPTCLYEYRLNRLSWGAWVSSTAVRVAVTLLIMVLSVFMLGFVADPILHYANPGSLLADFSVGVFDDLEELEDWMPDGQPDTWSWHFTRGFFALGIMGMFKTVFFMRPWHFIRVGGGTGVRRRGGGRDRLENISWVMVIIGALMFLRTVWKAVSTLSARYLNRFSDTIVDVPGEDDDEDDQNESESTGSRPDQSQADASPTLESKKDQ